MTRKNKQRQQEKQLQKQVPFGDDKQGRQKQQPGPGQLQWCAMATELFVAEDGLGVDCGGSAGGDPAGDEGHGD